MICVDHSNYSIDGRSHYSISKTRKLNLLPVKQGRAVCYHIVTLNKAKNLIFYRVWRSKEFIDWQTSEMECLGTG